jgi:hypothetical protein
MRLKPYQIDALVAAKLRFEQAHTPDCEVSVAVRTSTDGGPLEFIVTRSRRAV